MNEKLVQVYIEGMDKGYLTPLGNWLEYSTPAKWRDSLFAEEAKIGGEEDWFERNQTDEWNRARTELRKQKMNLLKRA
jgi:hypothetical protein